MNSNSQSGLTNLQIMTVLAAIVITIGAISLYSGGETVSETEEITENSADTATEQALVEEMQDKVDETIVDSDLDVEVKDDEMSDEKDDVMDDTAPVDVDAEVSVEAETADVPTAEPVVVSTPGTFSDYSADKLALAENGTVVLFFHAQWCPTCRTLESDLNASLNDIPAGTHILKLDYDTETELKKKYGVVRQHTLVEVDANGNEVKKLTGLTNTLEQVVNQL